MIQRTCKICGKDIDIIYFRLTNSDKNYRIYKCRDCERKINLKKNRIRHPLKIKIPVSDEILERRKKDVFYKNRKRQQKKVEQVKWCDELYEYIKTKNVFTDEELKSIYEWLKKVDVLGTF
jgi:DNA-directed RNA polymerase subunit RPC12/RpoP